MEINSTGKIFAKHSLKGINIGPKNARKSINGHSCFNFQQTFKLLTMEYFSPLIHCIVLILFDNDDVLK